MKKEILKIRTDVYGIENKQYKESIKMKFFEKTGQVDWLLVKIVGSQNKKIWEDTNIGNKKGVLQQREQRFRHHTNKPWIMLCQ